MLRTLRVATVTLFLFCLLTDAYGQNDTTAPTLQSLTLSQSSVDVSSSSASITFTMRVTDDLSGLGGGTRQVWIDTPSAHPSNRISRVAQKISGDQFDATYEVTIEIPQFAEAGTWTVRVLLTDDAGNLRDLNSGSLIGLGFPGTFEVVSTPDTTAPTLQSLTLSQSSVDVSSSSASITFTMRVTDDLSGLGSGTRQVWIDTPSAHPSNRISRVAQKISGDQFDATYEVTIEIPQFAEAGTWTVRVLLTDAVGNLRDLNSGSLIGLGFPGTFEVISTPDTTAPVLENLTLSATSVNALSTSASITFTMRVTDDLSGLGSGTRQVWIDTPSAHPSNRISRVAQKISGDQFDATYEVTIEIPQFAEAGTWTVRVLLTDAVGNLRDLNSGSLIGLGFPGTFEVVLINEPPVALFTASSTSGQAPHEIAFDASGSSDPNGDALSFEWDYGDGESSTGASVSHTYTTGGSFAVTLTVSDGSLEDTETLEVTIAPPNRTPTASFSTSSTSGQAPHEITFDASGSSDPDGDTLSHSWDFGDGTAGSGASVSHTYTTGGSFAVTLTVSDGSLEDTETLEVTIAPPNGAPTAQFTASSSSGESPHDITFNASASSDPEGDVLTYSWVFGDGSSGSGEVVAHTFTSGGQFEVVLTVSDGSLEDTESLTVTITEPNVAPVALFTPSTNLATAPSRIGFDASDSYDPNGDLMTYSWNFGDGATGSGRVTEHQYTSAGDYTVTLEVSDGALTNTATTQISIASGVGTDSESVPTAFELHGAYPNPFNPSTRISFSLPRSEAVSLWIVDVQGRVVSRLLKSETMPAGNHSVTFDASGLPSGNYIIYMRAGSYQKTRSVSLIK